MQIDKMDMEDVKNISRWDKYEDSEYMWEYEDILRYLEATSVDEYLKRVIKHRREDYSPDKRFAYVLRDKEDIAAFTFFALNECKYKKWDLFIQSIVVNPAYRGEGYGKLLLSEIFSKPLKYVGAVPDNVVALISPTNRASLKLFDSFTTFKKQWFKSKFYFIEAKYIPVYESSKRYIENKYLLEK